jgi:hypothetical protein
MRIAMRTILAGVLSVGMGQALGASSAWAQGVGSPGSLGGYGGSMSDAGAGMGTSGTIIPYAGTFGGFMPYRMGGGGSLSFRSRETSAMGSTRTSFSLSPMSDGMSPMSGGMGPGFGARTFSSFGTRGGMGPRGEMRQPMPAGMGVMPPSFGYPFRQPPSLVAPSTGMGMSM